MGKLNALLIQRLHEPGLYCDGNGLYLQVKSKDTKSWIFRFSFESHGRKSKDRWMGLGSLKFVSLADARLHALNYKRMLLMGINPLEKKKESKQQQLLKAASTVTFNECARRYIDSHKAGWKNSKHIQQWENTLTSYASPVIGKLSVQSIDTELIMKVLEPIWYTKTETASRLRGRLELILAWATVNKYRHGDNPARWNGHLNQLLPKRSDVQKVEHYKALPYQEISAFIEELRKINSVVALGLEFQILTATRTGEVIGSTWEEINWNEELWIIPAARMKAKREHRVPLSPRALEILQSLKLASTSKFVFSGRRIEKPISNMAFLTLLKKNLKSEVTAHGFRSSFRDWAGETTNHSRETIEQALSHSLKDKVEAAYRRGDGLMKRRSLMNDWSSYCSSKLHPAAVRNLHSEFKTLREPSLNSREVG